MSTRRGNPTNAYATQVLDRQLYLLEAKRNRVISKLKLQQTRFQQEQKGFPIVEFFHLGAPSCVCQYCCAFMWREESTTITRRSQHPDFSLCCNHGAIRLSELWEPIEFLKKFLQSDHEDAHHFERCIRSYNAVFCFNGG